MMLEVCQIITVMVKTYPSGQYTARNGETWTPLFCVKTERSNLSKIVSHRSGVNPSVHCKAESSPHDCWKLFV